MTQRRQCVYTIPDGVPYMDQGTFDRLHQAAGALAYTATEGESQKGIEGIGGTRVPTAEELVEFVDQARWVLGLAKDAADLAVERAREGGVTWQQIGDAFGMTREAAQMRFGRAKK